MSEKVLILRTCKADGSSSHGFVWPTDGLVECTDWNDRAECGGGLHGLLWGQGDWGLLCKDFDARWQVIEVEDAPDNLVRIDSQKIKFRRGNVVFTGEMSKAVTMVLCHSELFKKTFAEAKEKSSGDYSTAASSGDYSKAASSGYASTAASSGYASTAASSGDYSTAASSGNYSKAASSGNYSKAASSGNYSTAASSGYASTAASSGDYSTAASSGYASTAASSGNYSKAASSGNYSKAASSGDYSTAASSGDYSTAASSGDASTAASSGNASKAEATGVDTIAMVAGCGGQVKAGPHGAFAIAYLNKNNHPRILVGHVGEKGIKADAWYKVKNGKLVLA